MICAPTIAYAVYNLFYIILSVKKTFVSDILLISLVSLISLILLIILIYIINIINISNTINIIVVLYTGECTAGVPNDRFGGTDGRKR